MNSTDTVPFRELEAEALALMSPEDRAEFDAAEAETAIRLRVAELVYNARTDAGMTQAELARQVGTTQGTISAIENGVHLAGVILLNRIANALGGVLDLTIKPAA